MSLPEVASELDCTEYCSWCESEIDWDDKLAEVAVRYYWNSFDDRVRVAKHQECYEAWLRLARGPIREALGGTPKAAETKSLCWLMLLPGPGRWRYIKAEGPCWKGEIQMSFRRLHIVIGWQRNG